MGILLYERLSYYAPHVRGAMIGVDQFWLKAFINQYFDGNELAFQQKKLYKRFQIDFNYRPDRWDEHCAAMGYQGNAQPIYFLVILREREYIGNLDLPNQLGEYPIIYEYWNPCVALSNVKDLVDQLADLNDSIKSYIHQTFNRQNAHLSIGRENPDTAGTLGGFLQCPQSRKLYIVSCAHVLGVHSGTNVYSPGPYEGREISKVGEVKFTQLSKINASTCNPRKFRFNDDVPERGLDLAIAELESKHNTLQNLHPMNSVEHIRMIDSMLPHDEVFFYGKVSHKVKAQIKYVCIWDEILIDNKPHCFGDVFVLAPRQRLYVNSDICSPGDSGAWIISDFGGTLNWDGMLFAGDGCHAYCCFAEYILKACKNSLIFPYGLTLLP